MSELEYKHPLMHQLREEHLVTAEQSTEVLDEHERTGKPLRQLLLDMGLLTEERLLEIIARMLGTRTVRLRDQDIQLEVIKAVPVSIVRMYSVVPVESSPHAVVLATFDLPSPESVDEIQFVLTRDVTFVLAPEEDIKSQIARYYSDESESVGDMLAALETEMESAGEMLEVKREEDAAHLAQAANATPIVRFVNLVLYQAVQNRASDIHFEPFESEFKIRYRVDGALYEMAPPPKHLALPVTSRIKVMSGLNIAERRLPQDGRIQLIVAGRMIDFRVSTLPTQFGESVVLRVLDRSIVSLELENLGMPDDVFQFFGEDIDKPNGILIVTGPTGSGKTTTLYSALRRLNTIEFKLLTAEEPVEYDIEGIVQVPINEAIGVTFARALRSFLRQDPDIIMIGEIRDLETAEIAIQASLTGHLVFSTLHTNDASGAVTRLTDMNVEPFLITSTLEAVLAQRLVRTICQNCRTAYQPDAKMMELLSLNEAAIGGRNFYFGAGCTYCNQTGYRGRRGIYEYLRIKDPIRELINQRRPTLVIRNKAIEMGMRTLRDDGIRCIFDGYTTMEEVIKYT
ncbi:MAG: ATPase, T2SS/T4P/T4SS family [Kiritimatiellaeota bacterium]|nr:ATPase, T2SS/T4P/T4SS family [Kiritimatiellota bacterium]